ncbi:MAG TPA: T9SS type A sorting domain-containing protein, partial [Saprospiraceae bacterium]|nr:T9SS type A sorting domain-containing protein [Saprospiraceae bacterium]
PYNDRYCSNWPLPGGVKDYHRVLWSVEDGCGNLSTCEYLFRLEDCKQPSPVCVGLSSVVMPSSGSVTIWAKDFDASSFDDCTAREDLLFSFSGTTYQPSRVFDCAAIEVNGSPSFLVEIWVADEGNDQNCNGFVSPLGIEWGERNKDFCTTFIVIDDNEGVCGDGAGGVVETEEQETVELVTVSLTNPVTGQLMATYTTTENGLFHFVNPLTGYEITSERNDDHKNGVSTLDLVKIQKHLLGIQLLDSPYKLIAADANNSESVSALDLVEIRKLILGLYNEFPKNESWRFVNSSFEFSDPSSPWPFEEVVDVQGLTMGHDFVGVKIGDVNGNVVANATQVQVRNAKGILEFSTDVQAVVAGQTVTVPVSARNFAQILGYQFTMNTAGLNLTGVEGGALDMTAENVGIHEGAITVSWNKVSPVSTSDVLFTLTFTATESGDLSQMLGINNNTKLTEAEAYNGTEEILDVTLSFRNGVAAGKDYALFQNEPNPFEGSTVIGFTLPEAMDATVTVYDVTGKVVHVIEGSYAQGYNEIKVNRKDLAITGVMYYRLDANEFTATKKMVVID